MMRIVGLLVDFDKDINRFVGGDSRTCFAGASLTHDAGAQGVRCGDADY